MTTLRKLALGAFLAVSAFSTVTLTSCSKDDKGCETGYEGTDCKTLINAKFVGAYDGTETCTIGNDNYVVTLTATGTDLMKLTLTNVYNANYTATATITESNKFTFSGTESGATFTGTGTLSGSSLSIQYTISDAGVSNSCTFVGTKK